MDLITVTLFRFFVWFKSHGGEQGAGGGVPAIDLTRVEFREAQRSGPLHEGRHHPAANPMALRFLFPPLIG